MSSWPFVGRQKEAAYIRNELDAGRSVLLTGIYGIGRTALARYVSREMARDWFFVFADFARDPGRIWRDVFAVVFPKAQARLRSEPRSVSWTRFRVCHQALEDPRRHVVVLDNVARLSAPRLDLVRRLRERFQVLAIAEDFLPEAARAALCGALRARPPLRLDHLSGAATVAFFEECSRRHGLGCGPGELRGLARATGGFPLGMSEAMTAELRRSVPRPFRQA